MRKRPRSTQASRAGEMRFSGTVDNVLVKLFSRVQRTLSRMLGSSMRILEADRSFRAGVFAMSCRMRADEMACHWEFAEEQFWELMSMTDTEE